VFKALLFLGAGAIIHAVGSNELKDMGGLAKKMPQTAIVFVIGTLSLAGVPLFGGFASKEEVLGAVWARGLTVPFLMLLTGAFLTAFYMMRVVFLAFWGPARADAHAGAHAHADGGHGHGPAHDAPAVMTLPLWILAALALFVGIYFTFHHVDAEFTAPAWLTPAAVGVAVGGMLLAWLTYQRRAINEDSLARAFAPIRYAAHRGFWVDDAFLFVYRQGVLMFARLIGWTDRYIVDGVVNVVSAWTVMGGGALRRIQTGRVQDYVFGLAFGVLVVLWWLGGKL
jgi:NADH-quinone oxidoreductase subunit L